MLAVVGDSPRISFNYLIVSQICLEYDWLEKVKVVVEFVFLEPVLRNLK